MTQERNLASGVYDYSQNGADWGAKFSTCDTKVYRNQSPLKLTTGLSTKSFPRQFYADDKLTARYSNTKNNAGSWTGDAVKVSLDPTANSQSFTSKLAKDQYKMTTDTFNAVQFHFHAKSEHTIDGEQFDLELHTVHLPSTAQTASGFQYAVVGILFSVNSFTAKVNSAQRNTIDNFFDTLQLDASGEKWNVAAMPYQDLLDMIDFNNRFVYKGSLTTPPCSEFVYWNVIQKVYPISQKHVDLFRKQFAKATTQPGLITWGNWRVQIDLDKHDPIWINDEIKKDSTLAVAIAIIVICGVVLVTVCFMAYFILRMRNKGASQDQGADTEKGEAKEKHAVNDEHEGGEIQITQ